MTETDKHLFNPLTGNINFKYNASSSSPEWISSFGLHYKARLRRSFVNLMHCMFVFVVVSFNGIFVFVIPDAQYLVFISFGFDDRFRIRNVSLS